MQLRGGTSRDHARGRADARQPRGAARAGEPGKRRSCKDQAGEPAAGGRPGRVRRPAGGRREGRKASRPTVGTAHDSTGRPVGEGSTACSRARRTAGRETSGQAARPRRCGGCRTTCSPRRGIVLVWGDPSTRPVGSPCEAFPPGEVDRLDSRLEVSHTPRHVSRQLTEQDHPASAISPKPARACICR